MKRRLLRAGAFALAIAALFTAALVHYGGRYAALEGAVARAGGADATCFALVYGGSMDDRAIEAAQSRLGDAAVIERGGDGAVYGCFSAAGPLDGAARELMVRGVLGMDARVDRWVSARAATGIAQSREIPVSPPDAYAELSAATGRLLDGIGDAAVSCYRGAKSASARGARYHAAVREGADITYMLAEGYLPVDY